MKGNPSLREGGGKVAIPLLPWPIPWKTTLNILPSLPVQKFFRDGSSYGCPVYMQSRVQVVGVQVAGVPLDWGDAILQLLCVL